jgi:integrase
LNIYLTDKGASVSRPHELAQRISALALFFGTKRLDAVNGPLCRDYVKERGSVAAAKRELEDFRAAINHHRREGLCNAIVEVVVPEKAAPRERWLSRSEAARLIWAAWRYREIQKGKATDKKSRQHIARFILLGLYTGSRSGAIASASLIPTIGRGYVDLETGIFDRKPKGKKTTKKRQPSIRLPERLLAHIRRWQKLGLANHAVIEFEGKPIKRVSKAFARSVEDAKLGPDVTPHTLRHTAVTWAMQNNADGWNAAAFFGITLEMLERVYGHHRPGSGEDVGKAIMSKPKSQPVRQPVQVASK